VALSFKVFGVGLVQGRLIAVAYLLLATLLIYQAGVVLVGRRIALLAVALLLSTPTAQFLHFGRQVLGEVPATAWLFGCWLVWAQGVRTGRRWLYPLARFLLGAAMLTKMQVILFGFATLVLIGLLDRTFYRQWVAQGLLVVGTVAGACVALWFGWHFVYFGPATFVENLAKLRKLSSTFQTMNSSRSPRRHIGVASRRITYWAPIISRRIGLIIWWLAGLTGQTSGCTGRMTSTTTRSWPSTAVSLPRSVTIASISSCFPRSDQQRGESTAAPNDPNSSTALGMVCPRPQGFWRS
jgi:4-amino-4-deoxy-L-arabinose transferase-like glycosyltransferase